MHALTELILTTCLVPGQACGRSSVDSGCRLVALGAQSTGFGLAGVAQSPVPLTTGSVTSVRSVTP